MSWTAPAVIAVGAACAAILIANAAWAIRIAAQAALAIGVLATRRRERRQQRGGGATTTAARVSVVVAAMNEEHDLPGLLQALERQRWPGLELVLVDDRSTDTTLAIMEEFRGRHPELVRVVHNDRAPVGCNGKQQALDLGVAAASGELLVFTDADCTVPPQWVAGLVRPFADASVGVTFGQLAVGHDRRFIQRYQAYDQPLVHQYSTGSAGLGLATGCFGNNLAVRASALRQIGGFRALGFTPTEDAALIAASKSHGWRVLASTAVDTMITTAPQQSWRGFIHQHVRWNSGAFFADDPMARGGYRFVVLFLIASVGAAPLAVLWPWLALLPATSLVSIGALGLLSGLLYRSGGDRTAYLARLLPYTLFFMGFYAYITVLAIVGVRAEWKGARMPPRGAGHGTAKPRRPADVDTPGTPPE